MVPPAWPCAKAQPHDKQETSCQEGLRAWMTTSLESTTLNSSPQMRLLCPLSKSLSRAALRTPSSRASSSGASFSAYLHSRAYVVNTVVPSFSLHVNY